mgnify:CR=1 FL=1
MNCVCLLRFTVHSELCVCLYHCRYDQLATYVLGPRKGRAVLLPFQLIVLLGVAITYTVVSGAAAAAAVAAAAAEHRGACA